MYYTHKTHAPVANEGRLDRRIDAHGAAAGALLVLAVGQDLAAALAQALAEELRYAVEVRRADALGEIRQLLPQRLHVLRRQLQYIFQSGFFLNPISSIVGRTNGIGMSNFG